MVGGYVKTGDLNAVGLLQYHGALNHIAQFRTFPGQSWDISAAAAACDIPRTLRLNLPLKM
jgi:hypothetical protein